MTDELTFRGLVLRETALGESDKLLSVVAQDIGKILISCKGVRNIKSHRLACTQLFCYTEFTVGIKKGRYFLKEAVLLENFYSIREDIEKLSLAQYVAEVTEEISIEGEADNSVLSLALNTLYMLAGSKRPCSHIKLCFELRLATLIGFMPDLSGCSICGKNDQEMFIDIAGGTLICPDCCLENINGSVTVLSAEVLAAMRFIISADSKRIFSFTLYDSLYAELSSICENYLIYHLEKNFETLKFYHSLGF